MDLGRLAANVRAVSSLCSKYGIGVAAVTKCVCAHPAVVRVMAESGPRWLADSRVENLLAVRSAGFGLPLLLLRAPSRSTVRAAVEVADISLESEVETVQAIGREARYCGVEHGVVLMIDVGDLREGVWPDKAAETARAMDSVEGVRVMGIGTNHACYGGVVPSVENMQVLMDTAAEVEQAIGRPLEIISGGNSSALSMLEQGLMPSGVNQLRVGESILVGRYVTDRSPIPGLHQDAFTLVGEVIELRRKPSVPIGQRAQDAFGNEPEFGDRGWMTRAILDMGRQDVMVEGIEPVDQCVHVLGASSDHLILDVTKCKGLRVGDEVRFSLSYGALLSAMTSPYVAKVVSGRYCRG
jgi:predicted amino acid racemase